VQLDTEFIRLPLDFDADRLLEEVLAVPERHWRPHPQGNPGNSALPLIAVGGDPMNDATSGAMAPTPHLERAAYMRQVLASFGTVLGRARLMRLDGNTEATLHVDTNYYWAERIRVHVPIITSEAIAFHCGDRSLHMPAGQSWVFDAWRQHNVLNPTDARRIHLVADTVGSASFWDLVARGHRPFAAQEGVADPDPSFAPVLVPPRAGVPAELELERHNFPGLMTPWEMDKLVREMIFRGLTGPGPVVEEFQRLTREYVRRWRARWAAHASDPAELGGYQRIRDDFDEAIGPFAGRLGLPNGTDPVVIARQLVVLPAVDDRARSRRTAPAASGATSVAPASPVRAAPPVAAAGWASRRTSRFDRPIFIVAPPRSGTTLLFETLALSPSVWTIGGESHGVIEGVAGLHPCQRGWDSNRLGVTDARPDVVAALEDRFLAELRDRGGRRPGPDDTRLRLLEKTPKNSLRVPFLHSAFPDARFVFVQRDPSESLSSMIAAWESGRFVTYPQLPDWTGLPWSLLLTPEWRNLRGKELAEIVAEQWRMSSEILLTDLERLPADRWGVVGYHDLVADPDGEIRRLSAFLDIEWDNELDEQLPLSRYTLTPPNADKWRQHAALLDRVLPSTQEAARRGRAALARPVTLTPVLADAPPDPTSPYRSVSSSTFAELLGQLGSTVLASTYQSGKVVALRELDGKLNTHFRPFDSPMGMAYRKGRLAVGTRTQVWDYQNLPQVIDRLEEPGRYDACFVPRSARYTGDIRIHDVAWSGEELWAVATRFSTLVTLDADHSFVPRWQPSFISALVPEDRCHLNGLATVDNEIRFVTALGVSDTAGGWREHKASGGVIIDVLSGEIAAAGISMPHSPRWHRGRLWVLESGQGALSVVDLDSGKLETVAELPGFTRGLALVGPFAFVGLSEVREATTFGGLPLTARLEDRQCGIWVVNIETGETVAFLRFEDLVEEIFDVTVLPGIRFPEIAEPGSDAASNSFVVPTGATSVT
jgi:uncharacterized protein (TIGR03032 family)